MLEWKDLPEPSPEIEMWGTVAGKWQYIMLYDNYYGIYHVTAKKYPNKDKVIDLGEYRSITDAKAACEAHYSLQRR